MHAGPPPPPRIRLVTSPALKSDAQLPVHQRWLRGKKKLVEFTLFRLKI